MVKTSRQLVTEMFAAESRLTLQEVATPLGISRERVRQIYRDAFGYPFCHECGLIHRKKRAFALKRCITCGAAFRARSSRCKECREFINEPPCDGCGAKKLTGIGPYCKECGSASSADTRRSPLGKKLVALEVGNSLIEPCRLDKNGWHKPGVKCINSLLVASIARKQRKTFSTRHVDSNVLSVARLA